MSDRNWDKWCRPSCLCAVFLFFWLLVVCFLVVSEQSERGQPGRGVQPGFPQLDEPGPGPGWTVAEGAAAAAAGQRFFKVRLRL